MKLSLKGKFSLVKIFLQRVLTIEEYAIKNKSDKLVIRLTSTKRFVGDIGAFEFKLM
jgi:hypothetical protein